MLVCFKCPKQIQRVKVVNKSFLKCIHSTSIWSNIQLLQQHDFTISALMRRLQNEARLEEYKLIKFYGIGQPVCQMLYEMYCSGACAHGEANVAVFFCVLCLCG